MRCFPDLIVDDVAAGVGFYRRLLGLEVVTDHGWYAELGDSAGLVLVAFVERGHETLPYGGDRCAQGILASFEVDEVEPYWATALAGGMSIVHPLTEELGQRHFMVLDPHGVVVDVIQRVRVSRADVRRLAALRRLHRDRHGTP